eukprot:76430_1
MADLQEALISKDLNANDMTPQQMTLEIQQGEKLLPNDLVVLGLEEDANHMRIDFDNDKSAKYFFCKAFIIMASQIYLLPVFLLLAPCFWYNSKVRARSRVSAVTDTKLVLKQGFYGCCCVCYNESTKSVPLDKITDVRLDQGCIQKCYNIHEVAIETASSTQGQSEIALIGLHRPRAVRRMLLKARDNHGLDGMQSHAVNKAPQLNMLVIKELETLTTQQHETMIEIKDVLQDMKPILIRVVQKMGDKINNESTADADVE